jgi:RND family efflux transporter MFP subunit
VCSIAQLQELEAVIDVPENQRLDANPATTQATFWSLPGVSCHARLREISPTADPLSRTFRARFTLLDPSPEIKLGMTVTIALDSARVDRGFDIPASCIVQVNNQPAVWRIAPDGSLTAVPVHVVQYSSDFVRVEGELHTGDRIVSAGAHRLDAGVRVRTWETQQ